MVTDYLTLFNVNVFTVNPLSANSTKWSNTLNNSSAGLEIKGLTNFSSLFNFT